ncbi:O-antigen ligase family protein [Thermosynechococcaceae cyanobacterium BACA0444]|uniref:O-antigen ligase family protein n=1 Tax=Pseudocalidococcus azoricus BACA0444 TaxID=2918990 RepID=A0AAE4JW26_9CYAN|nr:O-antigen ligase family protein [Pseudocalidococcus azoricus]MDS3860940.1 O-antigen ligase family protein [Pseudocalidococcus azoricus BACA0444]
MTSLPRFDAASRQEGKLIGLLLGGGYVLFTLLPDSHSLMVAWPWVFLWQFTVILPLLWLVWLLLYQRRWPALGNGLDWSFGLLGLGIIVSTLGAEFRFQSLWYAIAALGGIAAVYALTAWLRTPERRQRLLVWQGYLGIAFSLWSLFLWFSQTILPEYARLADLQELGIRRNLDLTALELRNWAPFGHQNYVAGYLLLLLPLLGVLAWQEVGRRRWLWVTGLGIGLIDFYFTNSRGGWLGLLAWAVTLAWFLLWAAMKLERRQRLALGLGLGSLLVVLTIGWSTSRLRQSVWGLIQGNETSELAYRWITANIGWSMGWSKPGTGTGLGSVPLLYQKFRPAWAGKEAEMAYQLHSTPVQVWAELGVWGILSGLVLVGVLVYWAIRWRAWLPNLIESDQGLAVGVGLALGSYGIMSLTDYQVDNIAIAGLLGLHLAGLAALIRQGLSHSPPPRSKWVHSWGWLGLAGIIGIWIWVWPIHQAWNLSSQGFNALLSQPPKWPEFVAKLEQAEALAPWEPYYPLQLGWNLGRQSLEIPASDLQQQFLAQAIAAFQRGNQLAPNLEFGQNNLGWLLLRQDPVAAKLAFARAIQLMPARPGNFYGLGLSLLAARQPKLAEQSFYLEVLRQPITITSTIWREPFMAPFYQPVLEKALDFYGQLRTATQPEAPLGQYARQAYAALIWWQGIPAAMTQLIKESPNSLHPDLVTLLNFQQGQMPVASLEAMNPTQALITAWLDPANRKTLLAQAWLRATQTVIPEVLLSQLITSIERSPDFDTWLRQTSPSQGVQYTRAGFGVLSRHIDGPQPSDFYLDAQNAVTSNILGTIWPTAYYLPPLDESLEPLRQTLVAKIKS